jgi:HPr kinase/phosphorylase
MVVDLAAPDAQRLPEPAQREVFIDRVRLPRLAVAAGAEGLPVLLALLEASGGRRPGVKTS